MTITITRDRTALMRHEIHIGPHTLSADMSAADGGEGLGPNPHDLYDAALGACEALTMIWYANRKRIPIENVSISIERDKAAENEGIYRLYSRIRIDGDLTDAQRHELLSVAAKCPISKLMTSVQTVISVSPAE
jgi:putative redox protein